MPPITRSQTSEREGWEREEDEKRRNSAPSAPMMTERETRLSSSRNSPTTYAAPSPKPPPAPFRAPSPTPPPARPPVPLPVPASPPGSLPPQHVTASSRSTAPIAFMSDEKQTTELFGGRSALTTGSSTSPTLTEGEGESRK